MSTTSPKGHRRGRADQRLVPVEVLMSEEERQAFRIAAIEEGSSMRGLGRMLITGWLNIRKMAPRDLDLDDEA